MNISELVIVAVLLVLLAEVTYLVAKLPRATSSRGKSRMIFVDTSVLIDGRIIAVAKSGFISDTLTIPRSVVGELQYLADHADHEKRARARHGLDIVAELQQIPQVSVTILQDGSAAKEGVDERLLALAKKHGGAICTIDYNLNKVAIVEGIDVLNINELAQSLRMAYLPGERTLLELTQKGQDSHQGVGHLSDGTMVVVENAASRIGTAVEVEFIRSLQTAAGKMMFARLVEQDKTGAKARSTGRQPVAVAPRAENQQHSQPAQGKGRSGRTAHRKPAARAEAAQSTPSAPAVYHAEPKKNLDKSTATSQQNRRRPQQRSVAKPRSNDHEAALIDLVDKQ